MRARLLILLVLSGLSFTSGDAFSASDSLPACQVSPQPADCANLWATFIDVEIPPGKYTYTPTPGCLSDVKNSVTQYLIAAAAARNPKTALFAGEIGRVLSGPLDNYVDDHVRGEIGRALNPHGDNTARCATLTVNVPAKGEAVGFRLEMTDHWEGGVWRRCHVGDECGQGWCKFPNPPVLQGNEYAQLVTVQFMNWSDNRPRHAKMTVFYKLPAGHPPPLKEL
jgi:hypothetical protein